MRAVVVDDGPRPFDHFLVALDLHYEFLLFLKRREWDLETSEYDLETSSYMLQVVQLSIDVRRLVIASATYSGSTFPVSLITMFLNPWFVVDGILLMPIRPIVARLDNTTEFLGSIVAGDLSSPAAMMVR